VKLLVQFLFLSNTNGSSIPKGQRERVVKPEVIQFAQSGDSYKFYSSPYFIKTIKKNHSMIGDKCRTHVMETQTKLIKNDMGYIGVGQSWNLKGAGCDITDGVHVVAVIESCKQCNESSGYKKRRKLLE
jgi:hypothetical protein